MNGFLAGLALCAFHWLAASRAAGATLTVTTLVDIVPGSLRAAISGSAPGDTITFSAGLAGAIGLTNGELLVGHSLVILGPGANILTVNGQRAGRVFNRGANERGHGWGRFGDLSPVIGALANGTTNYVHAGGATNGAVFYRVRLNQ